MKRLAMTTIAAVAAAGSIAAHASGDRGTEAQAQEMVRKAVALIKSDGPDKAYKVFNDPGDKMFHDRDLFVFVYHFNGTMLAMGSNPRMVGKNLIDMKDADGMPLARGMIDMIKARKKGWYGPYKFANPATGGYEYKKSYCEQASDDTFACVGVHTTSK